MRSHLIIHPFAFFLLLSACKKDTPERAPQGDKVFTVSGTLMSANTKQPVASVGIAFTQYYTCKDGEPTAVTDSAGNFRLVHGWSTEEKGLKLHLIDRTGCYTGSFELLDGLSGGRDINLGKVYAGL